jgi:hypothetical protein
MVGDLNGIMGQAMPKISTIDEPPMLEGKPEMAARLIDSVQSLTGSGSD